MKCSILLVLSALILCGCKVTPPEAEELTEAIEQKENPSSSPVKGSGALIWGSGEWGSASYSEL